MLRIKRKGQSVVEYAFLLVVVMGVLITMSQYIKRGVQGRWKALVDDMGSQYDPKLTDIQINHTVQINQDSYIHARELTGGGFYTQRVDQSNTLESKIGQMITGIKPNED